MNRGIFLLIMTTISVVHTVNAQDVALKTNILSDAFMNINAGIEVGLAPRWTLDVSGGFNAWTLSHNRRWKHWAVQPEARYWFCDRFAGHFIGIHVHGGQYNLGGIDINFKLLGTDFSTLKDTRYQGWFLGGGIAYGYTCYDRFKCAGCGKKIEKNKPHNYFGPTKAAVNLVYLF